MQKGADLHSFLSFVASLAAPKWNEAAALLLVFGLVSALYCSPWGQKLTVAGQWMVLGVAILGAAVLFSL